MTPPNLFHRSGPGLITLTVLISLLLAAPAAAETVTLTFQGIGISTQDIDVFDANGAYLYTTNSTSTIGLNVSESSRYTLQLKPTAATVDPVSLIDYLIAWLTDHVLIVVLLLVLVIALGGVFRRH